MPSRRRLLALVVSGAISAGCSAPTRNAGGDGDTVVPSLEDGDRVRGTAPLITLERDLSLGELETYVAANHTIKYPKSTSGGGEYTYGYVSRSAYLRMEAGVVAMDAVRAELDDHLQTMQLVDVAMTGDGGDSPVIEVRHLTYLEDDAVVEAPPVSAGQLVGVTPESVDVTVHLRGGTHATRYPVFVRKTVDEYPSGRGGTDATKL